LSFIIKQNQRETSTTPHEHTAVSANRGPPFEHMSHSRSIVDVDREHRERERREAEKYAKSGSRRESMRFQEEEDSASSEEEHGDSRKHEERVHHHGGGSKSHRDLSTRRHEREPPRGHKSSGSLKPRHHHHHHSHPHSPHISSPPSAGDRSSFSGRDSWKNFLPDTYEGVQAMDHTALESTLMAFMNEERDKTLIRLRDHGYNPLTGLVVRGRGYEYEDGP